jgi:hypothetical protein
MKYLRLSIDDALAPGEPALPVVVSGDDGDSPTPAPITLLLTCPSGEAIWLPVPAGLDDPPAGCELSATLPLGRYAAQPGEYRLAAAFGSEEAADVRWFQESAGAWNLALPAPANGSVYALFQGERLNALYRVPFRWDEDNAPDDIEFSSPVRLCRTGAAAHSLAVASGPANATWLAWLEDGCLHAGIEYFGWQQYAAALPFAPAQVLPQPIVTAEGHCQVLVANAAQDTLALVQFPILGEEAAIERAIADAEDELRPLPEPSLLWQYAASTPFAGAAIAGGGLVLVHGENADTILRYAPLPTTGSPETFTTLEVAGKPCPGIHPAIASDEKGRAHVAVLVEGAIARASFDAGGRSRLDGGTQYHPEPSLATATTAGIIRLIPATGGSPWRIVWAVSHADGSVIANGVQLPQPLLAATPPALLHLSEKSFVATRNPAKPAFAPVPPDA